MLVGKNVCRWGGEKEEGTQGIQDEKRGKIKMVLDGEVWLLWE